MVQPAFINLDLMRKTALQGLARVIEPLLRIAYPVEQLALQRARATFDVALEIYDIGDNQFGGSAWSRRPKVCGEIANGKIDFVADGRDDWQRRMENRARDDLFIELPQVFNAPAPSGDHDQIDRRKRLVRRAEFANGHRNFLRCSGSLHAHRVDQNLQPWRPTREHVQHIADCCSARRGYDSNSPRKF